MSKILEIEKKEIEKREIESFEILKNGLFKEEKLHMKQLYEEIFSLSGY